MGSAYANLQKEETAGGVTKLCVRRYGDLDAGGLLPGCVDRLSGKQSTGRRALSASNDRTAVPGCARASLIIAGQRGSDTERPRWGVAAN